MNQPGNPASNDLKKSSRNLQYLKNHNRAYALKALALSKATNRSELANELGLTRMAITKIVNELSEAGLIKEFSYCNSSPDGQLTHSSQNGRRPKRLTVTEWQICTICIHIKRYAVSSMLMDITGKTDYYSLYRLPESADNQDLIHIITSSIDSILTKADPEKIIGIGISSIGPLDIYGRRILNPPDFCQIHDLKIGDILGEKYHLPVYLDNDMNCSALAEHYWGIGKSHQDLVFLGFFSGVGAGVMMNGKILHGSGGYAGEMGHISINPHGPKCSCGQRGCVELYTAGVSILKNVGLASFQDLNQILEQDSPPMYITNYIEEYVSAMKTLVVIIANSFDPEIIILGDIDTNFIGRFTSELTEYVNNFMLNHGYKHIPVVTATLGKYSSLYGAGSIVFQRVFDGELSPLQTAGGGVAK